MTQRVFNFSAGPSTLPLPVMEKAKEELLNFRGIGMSVMEISHRSKPFEEVITKAEAGVRRLLGVPQNYSVLFIQGGASLQFAMAPMNLYRKGRPVDVIHTGLWTQKAIEELKNLTEYRLAATTEKDGFRRLPKPHEIKLNPDASYVHLCSNNTVAGTQWRVFPDTGSVPLVADMSSDILSRRLDVTKFGLIYAGAQKNLGPSGVSVTIIRDDLAERADKTLPIMMQYRTHIKNKSLYNTPPTFQIYIIMLVTEWIESEGGLDAIEKKNQAKADCLYQTIDSSSFYQCPINKEDRSLMNVVFRIQKGNKPEESLENKFVAEAEAQGLSGLKGHRLAGGLRASIYNAQTIKGVEALCSFMKDFESKNS